MHLLAFALLVFTPAACLASVHTVHLIFSCHLDVGFGGIQPEAGLDSNVINKYFLEHFPKAIQSFLASLYLDCPNHIGIACPNDTEAFRAAVRRGDITWHALPHNAQAEVYDPDLLMYAVQLTHELDQEFGLRPKITMSQRDVPGLTRAAIPILYGSGVRALSVGVNGASAPPGVPKNTPFWWRDELSGKELLCFWHPGGYSGVPVDSRDDCVRAKGFHRVLCLSWRGDNAGPPSIDEVLQVFGQVREGFPGAEVVASTFDEFVEPLLKEAPGLDLSVVTGEIGDTWIHGIASDPGKLAEFRALLRIRRATSDRWDDPQYKRFSRLLLKVPEHTWGVDIKTDLADWVNWDNKAFHAQLANRSENYQVTLRSWLRQRAYLIWAVQELGDSEAGVKALTELASIQTMKDPPRPRDAKFSKADLSQPLRFACSAWGLELDGATGAVVGLEYLSPEGPAPAAAAGEGGAGGMWSGIIISSGSGSGGGASSRSSEKRRRLSMEDQRSMHSMRGEGQCGWGDWGRAGGGAGFASREHPLAQIMYSMYAEDDYSIFWDDYNYQNERLPWFYMDFGKPNATEKLTAGEAGFIAVKGGAKRADVFPKLEEVWHRQTSNGGLHVITKSRFPAAVVEDAGAPRAIWTEIRSAADSDDLYIDIIWENKTATRLPETLWVRWRPDLQAVDPSSWVLHKLGQPISPLEVILNGSHSLHAVGDEGVSVRAADGGSWLNIRSLDAALVSPGAPTPFPNLSSPPDLKQGVSFALCNNIWGTNYVMWAPYQSSDANFRFRFVVQLERVRGAGGDSMRQQQQE